jgi:LmbE family N-acetylglucosaminyl deacetylase
VSRWTRVAFDQASNLRVDAPLALYYLAVPRSVAQALGLARLQATPDEEITLAVDVGPVWEAKLSAIRCHRTQVGESPILHAPAERQRLFLGQEHFQRAARRGDHDLAEHYLMQNTLKSWEDDE